MQISVNAEPFASPSQTQSGMLVCDATPPPSTFASDVLAGLAKMQKEIPSKYLYDQTGSELFEQICATPEYYPTRTELSILHSIRDDLNSLIPAGALIIELGSGSHQKIDALLPALRSPAAYVPIDISREFMLEASERVNARYPDLTVIAICADYTNLYELPEHICAHPNPRLVFFPGSTIGNFTPAFAEQFLSRWKRMLRPGDQFLCGVDLVKNQEILEAAYNDAEGITARFNLNLLDRMNRELGANFATEAFRHRAHFNESSSRIEMHLVCIRDQTVTFPHYDAVFEFRENETIHTENSFKYTPESFCSLATHSGFEFVTSYTDPEQLFSLNLLVVPPRKWPQPRRS